MRYDCPGDLSSPRWRLAALPAVALYPASRARMLWTRALTFMLAAWPDWPRLSWLCPLRVVPRTRGPCVVTDASCSSSRGRSPCWRRPQLWSMSRRLRPGRSGPGAALHVGIPARLTRARRAPSPPRGAVCTLSRCCSLPRSGLGIGAPPRWRRSELWSWLASRARMSRTRTSPSRG